MPELPEVETTARSLRARLIGLRAQCVGGVDWPRMLPQTTEDEVRALLVGLCVTVVDRRGKYLLIGFDDGTLLRFVDARKFGRVYLFHSSADRDIFIAERLGPEPLTELDAPSLRRMLQGRRGRLKSLLLDQAFLAGVGNLYADEALWVARLHPLRTADSLSAREI